MKSAPLRPCAICCVVSWVGSRRSVCTQEADLQCPCCITVPGWAEALQSRGLRGGLFASNKANLRSHFDKSTIAQLMQCETHVSLQIWASFGSSDMMKVNLGMSLEAALGFCGPLDLNRSRPNTLMAVQSADSSGCSLAFACNVTRSHEA